MFLLIAIDVYIFDLFLYLQLPELDWTEGSLVGCADSDRGGSVRGASSASSGRHRFTVKGTEGGEGNVNTVKYCENTELYCTMTLYTSA